MSALVLAFPGNEGLAEKIADQLGAEIAQLEIRRFPDEESYARIDSDLQDRQVILVASLDRPDEKILQLVFLAATARELGAASVGLAAPYLAYMRQDKSFHPGEAVTSKYFAKLLSDWVDWIVTIDPHLHRRSSLNEIYTVPSQVLHAAPLISEWIKENVTNPVLIGPDEESAQWVGAVAAGAGAPHVVLQKERRGDRDVKVTVPDLDKWQDCVPVLVDDIISTARTMIETLGHLDAAGMKPAQCIGVHGVFAGDAFKQLENQHPAAIISTNSIPHTSNKIDVSGLMAEGIKTILK